MVKFIQQGWGTNKEFNFLQLKSIRKNFPNLNITYIDGIYPFSKNEVNDPKVKQIIEQDTVYSWIDSQLFYNNDKDSNFKIHIKTLDFFKKYLEENDPFDVYIGFSQGAVVVMSIIQNIQNGYIKTKFPKFVIIAGSTIHINYFLPQDKQQNQILNVKSIHFIGQKDPLRNYSNENLLKFKDPLLIKHQEGHKFPNITDDQKSLIKKYLNFKISPKL